MTVVEIIANIISFIGTTLNIIGINIKDKRKTLLFFILGNTIVATSLGLLNATSGMIVQIIFVIETIINYFWDRKYDKYPIWMILLYVIFPCIILTITFNTIWDLIPIMGGILFPLALLSKNFKLRLLNLLSVVIWVPYSFHFGQYVGAIGCTIFTIMNIIAIIRFDIKKEKSF